jgi:hypothetical protein
MYCSHATACSPSVADIRRKASLPPSSFRAVKHRRVIPQAEGAWQGKNGTILRCGSQRTPWIVAAVGARRIMMHFEDIQCKIGSESDFAIFVQTEGGWQTFDSSFCFLGAHPFACGNMNHFTALT